MFTDDDRRLLKKVAKDQARLVKDQSALLAVLLRIDHRLKRFFFRNYQPGPIVIRFGPHGESKMIPAFAMLEAIDPSMVDEVVKRELTTVINDGPPDVRIITDLTAHEEMVGEGLDGQSIVVTLVDIDNDTPPSRSEPAVISGVFSENERPLTPKFSLRFGAPTW